MILCKEEYAKKINSAVFPGQQGGPLEHVIAGKAVAFKIAATRDVPRAPAAHGGRRQGGGRRSCSSAGHGVSVLTGGTDVHLVLVDLRESELDGQQAEDRLHEIGITVNRNAVPFDPRPPMVTSGLRVGTPALATRGLQADDFPSRRLADRPRAAAGLRGRPRASWPSASRRSPSATRCTRTSGSARPSSAGRRGSSGRTDHQRAGRRLDLRAVPDERLAGASDGRGQDEVPHAAQRDLDAGEQQASPAAPACPRARTAAAARRRTGRPSGWSARS